MIFVGGSDHIHMHVYPMIIRRWVAPAALPAYQHVAEIKCGALTIAAASHSPADAMTLAADTICNVLAQAGA